MNIAGICALAVTAAILALHLRELRPDMARLLALAASLVVMGAAVPMAAEFVAAIKDFSMLNGSLSRFLSPMLKVTGLAYISQFAAELCRDAGETALAGRVELAGKTAITLMSFPVIKEVFMSLMNFL